MIPMKASRGNYKDNKKNLISVDHNAITCLPCALSLVVKPRTVYDLLEDRDQLYEASIAYPTDKS